MQLCMCFGVLLSANVCAMDLHKKFSEIRPEQSYSVSEAARFLGIHRCTIYDYITHTERPLPFFRMQGNLKIQFRGNDLIAYKTAGLPKKVVNGDRMKFHSLPHQWRYGRPCLYLCSTCQVPDRFKQLTDHTFCRFHVGQHILHSVGCAVFAVSVAVQP